MLAGDRRTAVVSYISPRLSSMIQVDQTPIILEYIIACRMSVSSHTTVFAELLYEYDYSTRDEVLVLVSRCVARSTH